MRNSNERYGTVARALHWAIGLLLLGQIAGGFIVFEFMDKSATRSALALMHMAMGSTLLLLVLARIAWRRHDRPPPFPAAMSAREQRGTRFGHRGLYLLMLAMPLIGLAIPGSAGRATDVFGLFRIPSFVPVNESLHDALEAAHEWGAYLLIALIVIHVGAALYHKFVKDDGILERML